MTSTLSPTFIIGAIRIGQIEGASCLNMGNNWISDFRSFKKHNQGFGSVRGDNNVVHGIRSLLNDPDTVDMLGAPPTSSELPEWMRRLIQDSPTPGHPSTTTT
ncbi:hypothetical protein GCM10025857_12000 [Alicyclobacillus contaminans]|uniref:hypothetical protein n=1 Tax=Alicyclobacillus contaminans TaxID=392016 RepID=UPI0003FFD8AD|nr:hypothetical protein [Alicyclobacillus contaminans]GMA49843.1 hypothetical protein GCM10025857_12000 [Alicyclobacillus contaminans]